MIDYVYIFNKIEKDNQPNTTTCLCESLSVKM